MISDLTVVFLHLSLKVWTHRVELTVHFINFNLTVIFICCVLYQIKKPKSKKLFFKKYMCVYLRRVAPTFNNTEA